MGFSDSCRKEIFRVRGKDAPCTPVGLITLCVRECWVDESSCVIKLEMQLNEGGGTLNLCFLAFLFYTLQSAQFVPMVRISRSAYDERAC